MKTKILVKRKSPTHSTSIELYRRAKAKKRAKVKFELSSEIKKYDIRWGIVFKCGLFAFTIGFFFALLLLLTLVLGYKF
ncbi:hypothetical protein [Lysinibacillus capsici]|uniref:hypothetical protein n=1 Tax=Lysinibacillus capsici TaxID=2115968 RepID=UPI00248171BA|nr:hypothetical protein [Lysinibacillus capsici]